MVVQLRRPQKRTGKGAVSVWGRLGILVTNAQARMQVDVHFSHRDSELENHQEGLVRALRLLYDLLEEYAPSWYTGQHHQTAEEALQAVKRG
jgi:hypothetical protein